MCVVYILTYYNIIFSIYMIYIDISLIYNICMIYNRYHVMCISRSPVIRLEFVHGKARVWQSILFCATNMSIEYCTCRVQDGAP